jgi:CspA family cold shock protein
MHRLKIVKKIAWPLSYGFIKPDDGGADVFVHMRFVKKAGYSESIEGARVNYDLQVGRNGKMVAENLRIA